MSVNENVNVTVTLMFNSATVAATPLRLHGDSRERSENPAKMNIRYFIYKQFSIKSSVQETCFKQINTRNI